MICPLPGLTSKLALLFWTGALKKVVLSNLNYSVSLLLLILDAALLTAAGVTNALEPLGEMLYSLSMPCYHEM